jgi:Tol biopolymer transport system component
MTGKRQLAVLAAALAVLAAGCSGGSSTSGENARATAPSASGASSAPALLAGASGWIAYQTTDGADDRVHLVRVDGTKDHAIDNSLPGRTAHPDFSTDGKLVIDQLTSDSDVDQLYIGAADGQHLRLIARCRPPTCLDHWEAAWSPDARRLAISTAGGRLTDNGPSRFGLGVVDVHTQQVTSVIDHASSQGQDHFARWSPNGSQLVFWRERLGQDGTTQTAIFRVDVDGQHLLQLTPWSMSAGDPDWSPDRSSIVFSTHPLLVFEGHSHSELFMMRPDGTGRHQITHNGEGGPRATQPRWTPDGRAILYVHSGASGQPRQIYVTSPGGSRDEPVLTQRSLYTHPEMQPDP